LLYQSIQKFLELGICIVGQCAGFFACNEGGDQRTHGSPVVAGDAGLCAAVLSLIHNCGENNIVLNGFVSSGSFVGGTKAADLVS